MSIMMNNFSLSQTEPISSLPREYSNLLKRAKKRKEPVIFLKRNKPVAALLDWELLKKLMNIYQAWQRKQDFASLEEIRQSLPDYSEGEIKEDVDKTLKKIRASYA